jgi:hypothetical protein
MREEIATPEEEKPKPKPVDFKENIRILMQAFIESARIDSYKVMEKDYPSDLSLYFDGGSKTTKSPTLVRYIARAEVDTIKKHMKEVIETASGLIQKDLDEIRDMLSKGQ